jgi:hypothetical protein
VQVVGGKNDTEKRELALTLLPQNTLQDFGERHRAGFCHSAETNFPRRAEFNFGPVGSQNSGR